jgi:hypothetical protein
VLRSVKSRSKWPISGPIGLTCSEGMIRVTELSCGNMGCMMFHGCAAMDSGLACAYSSGHTVLVAVARKNSRLCVG